MNEEIPFKDDPDWLTLPIARRELALRRRAVFLDYERNPSPGDAEAEAAAGKLGITTGQFYRLRRKWMERRTIFSLIPYGRPGVTRAPRLDADVIEEVRKLVNDAVGKGARTPGEILRTVREKWSLKKPCPSHMTLRSRISDALATLEGVSGNIVFTDSELPEEFLEDVTGHGQAVVIDHSALDLFLSLEAGPAPALLTLVIDIFTNSIAGFRISSIAPGPLQVQEALHDAHERTGRAATGGLLVPRLAFSCSTDPAWQPLLSHLVEHDIETHLQKRHRLGFGALIGRLIGKQLGGVRLSGRQYMNEMIFDPLRDALVNFGELERMVEQGVRELNERRIPAGTTLHGMDFGIHF